MKRSINMAFVAVALAAACGGGQPEGRLGITAPEGRERVTCDAPYLITGTEREGPAHRAGIRPNDRILRINGKKVDGMPYDEVRNLLGGPAGTTVTVTVERAGVARDHMILRGL